MGYLTKYGSMWGDVPQTTGRVFWVAPASPYTVEGRSYSSSDNNDGLTPERALATIGQAISNATANVGDVIMLLNGSHTNAAVVAISKAGLTFVGCHPFPRVGPNRRVQPLGLKTTWTSTLAGTGVTLTAADCTFIGINFVPVTAQTFMSCTSAASRTTFLDCLTTLSAVANTATKGIVFTGAADSVTFTNCYCLNTIGAQGPWLDLTAVTNFRVEECTLVNGTGSWAIGIQLGAGSTGDFMGMDIINKGTAITIGVDGTGVAAAASVFARNCYSTVSPAATSVFKNFTSTDLALANCYIATISAGTGGTLITTTT